MLLCTVQYMTDLQCKSRRWVCIAGFTICSQVLMCLHDNNVLFFLFLLQKEKEQFAVSLLIVHLMKVVTTVCACTEC